MRRFDWQSLLRFQGGSLLMILFGIILAARPDSATLLISSLLGWLLIAVGVVLLVSGVIGGLEIVTIIQGVGLLVAGGWLHRHPLMIASVLGIVLGLVALSQGWRKGKMALRKKDYGSFWILDAGMAVLELLAGVMLIFSPLRLSRFVMTIVGIFMVICGVVDLIGFWRNGD